LAVCGLAVGQRAEPGILAGHRQVRAKGLQVARIGGPDVALDGIEDPGAIGLVADERHRHDRRGRRRGGEEPLQLVDGPVGHDACSGQAGRPALGEQVDDRVGERRVGSDPGQQPLEALRRIRLLEVDDLGEECLVPLLAPERDEVGPEVVLQDLLLGDEDQQIARDPLLRVEAGRVDRQRSRARLLGERPEGGPPCRPRVVESIVVPLVPEDGGERGLQLQRALPGARAEVGKRRRIGHPGSVPAQPGRCRAGVGGQAVRP
jgi:hypothetical protein